MGKAVETLMAASGLSGSIQSCDGATIRDGKLAGFKLVSQRALGLKNDLVNVYAVAGRCVGFITDADVAAFVGGDAGGFTPEGGWRDRWSSQLIDLLGLRGTAADQVHEAQETSRALAEQYPNKGKFTGRMRFSASLYWTSRRTCHSLKDSIFQLTLKLNACRVPESLGPSRKSQEAGPNRTSRTDLILGIGISDIWTRRTPN